jgi:hypothetical protein
MVPTEGNLLSWLTGGTQLKQRVQHPDVHERKFRGVYQWFFRYYEDVAQPDGSIKTIRRSHVIGPSRDKKNPMSHKEACQIRDRFLADLHKPKAASNAEAAPQEPVQAVQAAQPTQPVTQPEPAKPDPGTFIFGHLAQLWRRDYVDKVAAGKYLLAKPTREKYANHMDLHIFPRWKDARLADLRAKVVQDWLQDHCTSWHMMSDLRGVMSGVITKAIEWEILPATFANPMKRVKLPKKTEVREKRILTTKALRPTCARRRQLP